MKQSQLNIFTDVISRSLERPYSSLLAEPVPPRLQALLDRLALAGGPAEEQSPWIHYQRSCDCPGAMSELGGQHPRSSPRRRLRHRPAPVAALRRRQCRSARCFCQAPPPLLQPRRRQPHHRRRSLGGMEEHRDRRAAEVVHHDHHGRERLHSAGSLAHASRTRELRALALRGSRDGSPETCRRRRSTHVAGVSAGELLAGAAGRRPNAERASRGWLTAHACGLKLCDQTNTDTIAVARSRALTAALFAFFNRSLMTA